MNNTTPLLTQVRTAYFSADCGMAYIMRTADGKFVLIDSNWGEYEEPEHLLEILNAQNTHEGKPVIAAWFFTHAHPDHYLGFVRLCDRHPDEFIVEKIIYNFPFEGRCPGSGTPQIFADAVAKRTEAEVIAPHTGDKFDFAGTTFDVLYTWEDLGDAPIPNINNSSLVMRMQMGNFSVMWLGDAQKQAAEQIMLTYAPEDLKADIMQVAHHGYTGGSDALYRAIAAEIILWPVPEFRYDEMLTLPVNSYCKESDKIRATFISGIDDDTLDMTAPIEARQYFHHGTIRTDLSTGKMLPLNWCCLTGGSTGYTPARLVYPEEGGCRLVGRNARTLVQMVKNNQTAISDKYTFKICGTYDEESILGENDDPATLERLFGIMWNYPKHMVWDDAQVFSLPAEVGKPFAYTLTVDKTANKATLYDGDTLIAEWNEVTPASCGIHIIMKNISLTLTEVVYEG